ncbi:RING finger protein 17 isoform X2 [Rhinoderma darwinii]|uniref:RING finger protein 17 isoform X2 n=1 Tax=Rhinoderma darwinii TaxID=43563 RepID=UPI003F674EF6
MCEGLRTRQSVSHDSRGGAEGSTALDHVISRGAAWKGAKEKIRGSKMADGEETCDSCQHRAGDCKEALPCGHYLCGVCSCRMESLIVMCPLCEVCEPEDCDILICSEVLSIQNKIPVQQLAKERLPEIPVPTLGGETVTLSVSSRDCSRSTCSVDSNISVDDNIGSKMKQAVNESNVLHMMDTENTNSFDIKDNLYHKIDEALIIANNTLHHLNSAFKTLEILDAKSKLQEKSLSNSIHEAFGKLLLALKKRKSDVLRDLRAINEAYAAELQNAMKNIEKQKKCLETRVAFAEGLKQSPLVTVYCDLNQLVSDLKISFINEGALNFLKDTPDLRFSIDSNTMIKTFNNLGTISIDGSPKCEFAPNGNVAYNESHSLDVKPEHRNTMVHDKEHSKGFIYEPYESDFGCMKTDQHKMDVAHQLASGKFLPAFQESNTISLRDTALLSLSSPDVIIEEIIDEDRPFPFTEFNDCKPKRFKKSQKKMGACAPFCQKKIHQELVYLSHLVNPCNFYVHLYAQKRQIIMLERKLTTLSETCSQCCPTDVLELGEIIAFRSIRCNKWCRGSITELIPLESKCILKPCGPTRYKIEDITRLTLFLLDYGGSETFVAARFSGGYLTNRDPMVIYERKIDALHEILTKLTSADEESLRFMPPFAVNCSLDIVPQSPDGLWSKKITDHVLKMVSNKCALMKVFREEHNKLIVDLKKPIEKISSDMPVSLRDALVFLELAKFPSNVSPVLSNTAVTHYKDPILPDNITEVVVLVCHINDPSDFYIHVIDVSDYAKILDKIQDVYNSKRADDWQILCPVVGQACVAKYDTEDDQWYRAEIMAVPNDREAVIVYVDFGNVAKVNVAGLRSLKDEFMTLPRKAIGCRLAYIQPLDAGPWWSAEACRMFEELTSYKHLRCTSIGVQLENKLSVELFDVNPRKVTSLNTMLVKENVASFIPCTSDSGDHHLPLKEVWDPVVDILPDSVGNCMDSISLFDRKELDVFISHVVSPSKIYVQWLTTENILKSLQSNMFERYENSKPEAVQWQVNMQVAVHLQSDKNWRRGNIKNIISDSLVEVFCYDFGVQEVTDVTNLRTLDESLSIYGTMCLECSLMDIQPAGGCQNWTATACDFLSYYLCGATATMIIDDNASHWPLPVKILSKNEAAQLVDVAEYLVKKGLALRSTRRNKHNSLLEACDKTPKLPAKSCQEHDLVKDVTSEPKPECPETVTGEESDIEVPEEPAIEPYLPPLLPDQKTFSAKVSHVAEDGTIHVIQECLENELGVLMLEIQNSFKCLGLMAPYSWNKGEGCLIKGCDTMSYRGKVLDILGGDMIKVQYEDFGYTENTLKCHLYPSVFTPHIPSFSIPCQLNDLLPVGDHWQPDAIQFLKELLLERVVTIHIVEPPQCSHGISSVRIYCGNASVSAILEQYAHGIPKDCEKNTEIETHCITKVSQEKIWHIDFQELLQKDLETPLLPKYSSESLPRPGELYKAEVTHVETPNNVFICIKNESGKCQIRESGDGDTDPVKSILNKINSEQDELPCLTDFKTAMPCLAVYYIDGLLHRAKLQSITGYDPITCVVEFVDYGSTLVMDTSSFFQLPASLIQYPAKAIKVKLAGFKPPKEDFQIKRLSYCPEWSMEAMSEMIDLVQGKKTLSATSIAGSENTVFLYDEDQQLVHKPLITMGLAELDEM